MKHNILEWVSIFLVCFGLAIISLIIGYNAGTKKPVHNIEVNCNPNIVVTELTITDDGLITLSYITANQVVRTFSGLTLGEFNRILYDQPIDYDYSPPDDKNFKTQ